MSIVTDQIRRIDAHVDHVLLKPLVAHEESDDDTNSDVAVSEEGSYKSAAASTWESDRASELQGLVRKLSAAPDSTIPSWRLQALLRQSGLLGPDARRPGEPQVSRNEMDLDRYETELEWILVSKVTAQAYGLVLDGLLDQLAPLSDHIWYWDQVLNSYTFSSLYAVQTAPVRWWHWSKEVFQESKLRSSLSRKASLFSRRSPRTQSTTTERWSRFYEIVRETVTERSVKDLQRKMLSPVSICRAEVKHKRDQLKKLKEMTASGLGVLIDEGLSFSGEDDKSEASDRGSEWKGVVERSVALMDMVLKDVSDLELKVSVFEDKVFAGVDQDPELSIHVEGTVDRPGVVAGRLLELLQKRLPEHTQMTQDLVKRNGTPSRLVRYWLPASLLLISSSTLLRILVRRQADIQNWIADFGSTVRDFWLNWVIEPTRKVIGTIRHDSNSEIAIMSRDSLKADRQSLERMVVDFATDKPAVAVGAPTISEAQLADIRAKIREGDVTPVLRAYEKDLKSPFMGAIRGDLVRVLLIQVQKTKVDIEVAMSGIDSLLKSQELVFGFVGLTPGILVSTVVLSYLPGILFGSGRGARKHTERVGRCTRVLRNVDRILSEACSASNSILSYKDHGLLISEVHILRKLVHNGKLMPRDVQQEFLEDLDDLASVKGIQVQIRALERVRWGYARWMT